MKFFGKYRGTVENNLDPQSLGRIQVRVPAVLGDSNMSWAMPCVPYAGDGVGLFLIPANGANVWVEFEGGDPDFPIWSGCFWGSGQVPASPAVAETKVFKCDGVTLTIQAQQGGKVVLEVASPISSSALTMTFDANGIELVNGSNKVTLSSSNVSINDGALEVM